MTSKLDREEEVRAMARLEEWGVTRIQALARGAAGRSAALARRLEHMGRWKEMYDEDRGVHFYYNKARLILRHTRTVKFDIVLLLHHVIKLLSYDPLKSSNGQVIKDMVRYRG